MNYKLLFPTYRNRYRFVRDNLARFFANRPAPLALNLGTGEGDYDPMIADYCQQLISVDINERDIAFARKLNAELKNVEYRIENALELSFPDNHFDLLISVDVMEHVGEPHRMTQEIARVLRPGGVALVTFPQTHFPWTYDPINRALGRRAIGQGAYAFGHEYLVDPQEFQTWSGALGVEVLEEKALSGYAVALSEMYWTGLIQRVFKDNARNVEEDTEKRGVLRPSTREPALVGITDAFINVDHKLFGRSKYSVGRGFVLRKR